MDYCKSKYSSMPDNSYFDRRMANGDELSDIFDGTDYKSKCYSEDKGRPITVRVGEKYNYVVNNYILFDNWFVVCNDFNEYDKCTYAYRRYNENGIREGGVLIRRDGSFVTREEFLDIKYNMEDHDGGEDYALVKQYNGLFNFIDVNKGTKVDNLGIKADYIDYFHPNGYYFRIANGKLTRDEEEILWDSYNGESIAREKRLKMNFYNIKRGVLSPSLWFDYIEPFQFVRNEINISLHLCHHAIVHLNGKKNLIDQYGSLLFDYWFDVIQLYHTGEALAGILKSEKLKDLPDYYNDNYDFNPKKYDLYKIDAVGRIKTI